MTTTAQDAAPLRRPKTHVLRVSSLVGLAVAAAFGQTSVARAEPEQPAPPSSEVQKPQAKGPRIEIVTMDEGQEIFERYGHAAICVVQRDKSSHDICYNFGTIRFASGMTLATDFLRGRARFFVSRATPRHMIQEYVAEDRTVWVQSIDLPDDEAQALATELDAIYRDRTRNSYVYHHFFDNCSTRLRDLLDVAMHGRLRSRPRMNEPTESTYRDLGRYGLLDGTVNNQLLLAVADIFVGRALDRPPSGWEAMFLPRVLRRELALLGATPRLIHARKGPSLVRGLGRSPRPWFLGAAALLAAPCLAARSRARFVTASIVPGSLFLGLLGILTLGIGAMTGVPELRFSEGFFVFLPTDVAVPLMGPKLREKYAIGRLLGLLVVALLLATDVFRQPLWAPMLLPFAFFTALAVPLPRIAGRNKRIVEAPQEVGTPVANVAPPSS